MRTTSDPPPNEVSDSPAAGIDSQSLSASVRRGALWLAASNMLLRLANVSLTAVVAHILSPRDFGVFAVASTVYVIVFAVSELGLGSCLTRADLDIDSLAPTVATLSVLSSGILAAVMAAFAAPIAAALGSAAAADPIRVLSLALFLAGPFAVPYSQLARDFRQDKLFLANGLSFVSSTIALVILAKSGSGAMAFAWSRVVGHIVMLGALLALVPRQYRPGLTRGAISVVLRFGVPLAGANLVTWILLNVDYALVGHLLGATELGVYQLGFNVASWPYSVLGTVINNTSVPAFSRIKDDHVLLEKATTKALSAVTLIAFPMCAMAAALARPIVLTLYGAKWAASADVVVVLSLYGGVFIVCLIFANMFTSFGRVNFLLVLQLIWIATLIPAMALGVHRDGIVGAAYAHVAVIVPIVLPSYLIAVKRMTGIRITPLGKAVLPALLASLAAALAARGVASQLNSPIAQLTAGLAAGGVIYAIGAGRQAIAAFGLEKVVERILRFRGAAAQQVGLSADDRAKHSADYLAEEAPEALKVVGPMHGSILADPTLQPGVLGPEDLRYRRNATMAQAVRLHERDLIERERLLGPHHPHTLAARANLAYAHRQAGWLEKAIPLYERTLADWRRLLGPDHPRTLRSSNYLASAYREAGRLTEAIALYEQTLAERRRLLGPYHPSTLRSTNYLASAYRKQGRFAEAIALYEWALAGWHQFLGAEDQVTLRASSYLASAYVEAGRLAEAIPLCERTLASCIRVLGNDHALTDSVRRNLSIAHELTKLNS